MFNVFSLLREKARNAVLSGVADALTDIANAEGEESGMARLQALVAATAKALPEATPAEEEGTTTKRSRKSSS